MKIAVISPNASHLKTIGHVLTAHAHTISLIEGGKHKIRIIAEQEQPDLILVDGICCDPAELTQVEYVTTHHPDIAVILLCATHTPEFLLNAMRAGVREVLPSPVTSGALEAAVKRIASKRLGGLAKQSGKILAFIPCKGGSGATFLATNLGYQLAQEKSVLLIDLNLQFGEALSFVYDDEPSSTLADIAHDINRLDATFLAASTVKVGPNYSILAAPKNPAQAMEIKSEHIDAILSLAVTQYDFIVLDVGRTLDALTVKALDRADRIFPVLQAGLPYLRNANKLLEIFTSLSYPISKIECIINRFEKSNEISIDHIRRSLGSVTLYAVPNSYKEVNTSINHGTPMITTARSNAVTKSLTIFVQMLSPKEEENQGLLGRLFKRA